MSFPQRSRRRPIVDQKRPPGETLRRLRRGKRWSLGTLAERTGLSDFYLSRVENDSASSQADAVARLAAARPAGAASTRTRFNSGWF